MSADLERVVDAPARRFSFFVNRSADQAVVTLKGEKLFSGEVTGNLPDIVERARNTLKDVSFAQDAKAALPRRPS